MVLWYLGAQDLVKKWTIEGAGACYHTAHVAASMSLSQKSHHAWTRTKTVSSFQARVTSLSLHLQRIHALQAVH